MTGPFLARLFSDPFRKFGVAKIFAFLQLKANFISAKVALRKVLRTMLSFHEFRRLKYSLEKIFPPFLT